MGHVHHPGIKERGIAPLQFPSYQRPTGLDPSSWLQRHFEGTDRRDPLNVGINVAISTFRTLPKNEADTVLGLFFSKIPPYDRLLLTRWRGYCPCPNVMTLLCIQQLLRTAARASYRVRRRLTGLSRDIYSANNVFVSVRLTLHRSHGLFSVHTAYP